jgi:hypothetical protein
VALWGARTPDYGQTSRRQFGGSPCGWSEIDCPGRTWFIGLENGKDGGAKCVVCKKL